MNTPTHQLVNKTTGEVLDILSIDYGQIRMETNNGAVIFNVQASSPMGIQNDEYEVREYVAPEPEASKEFVPEAPTQTGVAITESANEEAVHSNEASNS